MQKMPQTKKQSRWEPKAKLRVGQRKLLDILRTTDKKQYSIQLPTGYGKSWCACIAYAVLREKGKVDRMLIIVPSGQQRTQYINGLRDDFAKLAIPISKIQRCDNQSPWVIKESFYNSSEVFVASIQSIVSDSVYYHELMSKGRWFVVADEFHHYGEENTWGQAIKSLQYEVILGMSATPFRGDKRPTVFGNCDFDVVVTIKQALLEKAIRPIEVRIGDYMISWSSIDNETPRNSLMSELEKEWNYDISQYEIKKGVRYHDKYISEIFLQVMNSWYEYEAKYPGQNQILVFAMTCRHAEFVTKVINQVASVSGSRSASFADWIGVGEGLENNRSEQENEQILERFLRNELPCLIQVNKAGEGFNNNRCTHLVFLNLIGYTPQLIQNVGRGMRINPLAPGLPTVIFISEDHPGREALENLQDECRQALKLEDEDSDRVGSGGTKIRDLPPIIIIDTNFESERIVYPFGSIEAALQNYLAASPQEVKDAYAVLGEEEALRVFRQSIEPWLKAMHQKQHPPLTEEQKRQQVSKQVMDRVGLVVNTLLRVRYGRSFPASVKGDYHKLIHSEWKRLHGSHAESTIEDLYRKFEWLNSLYKLIQEGKIPTWLNL